MHWTPEHAQPLNQWPEQHLDVSSTTSSPAHKSDLYHSSRQRFNYAWANDDISALTASNLLKRYAEKYSGVLDTPYERPSLSSYPDGAFGPVNGQKGDLEPWQMSHSSETAYPLNSLHDGLSGSKAVVPPAVTPGNGPGGLGSPPVGPGNLPDPIYPSNPCGGPTTSSGLGNPQEYTSGYSGTYLPSGYCGQPTSALPPAHPSALHSSGLLQSTHPSPALVPGYSSSGSIYNYASGSYPPQPGIGPAYGAMHAPHPSSPYLPSGIAAPTPLPPPSSSSRPPVVPSYSYQGSALTPIPVAPLSTESSGPMKRKAFDMAAEEESDGRYRKYSYEQPKSTSASPYQMSDSGVSNECRGNGFNRSSETPLVPFKPGKRPALEEHVGKYNSQTMKALISPTYSTGEGPLRSSEAFEKFTPPLVNGEQGNTEQGHAFPHRLEVKPQMFCGQSEEQMKDMDPLILELVNNEMVDCGPPVQWTDIAGQVSVKAAIEEELVWPILRPGAYTGAGRPPRTILLFGPQGSGKTLLSRCVSTQLGSTLLKLSGTALVSKWKNEGEKILETLFFLASCRQPAVLFIGEVDALLSARASDEAPHLSGVKSQLLSYLDNVATSADDTIVVIGTTRRPGDLDEAAHRRFTRRFYICPPDGLARRQILHHALAQQSYCLSEREMASLVQHTEGYSGGELIQLCQQAGANQLQGISGQLQPTSYKDFEGAFCKLRASTSQKELDLYTEWNKMYGSRQ
ncbi:putative fidgetin-like protein 2 [Rhinatrema bivittatum]|uniref:putative fidgetin-like protein 2 n=1 Tax=Rhinatrema bivittatum TaxID=194408 RepID=UPI0011282D70|nr:putative fidgetin-like protein 2 [Rhinatrema bivittatum]XP_029450830.1 putative fidgetin-like protein 2 [Rhinatrema bivittatum]XP_029450831.1 putative fidgetin-like protein 2 [Rhinatrema bivittatum]